MAAFFLDCPHCDTINAGFTVVADFPIRGALGKWGVAGTCNICAQPILVIAKGTGVNERSGARPIKLEGDVFEARDHGFVMLKSWPEVQSNEAPANVPAPVSRSFVQASASRSAGHYDAACSMYRKSMELGLKSFSPDVDAWKIEKRIDKLASEHRITPELQAWAHELRLDGNEALHGDGEATKDMADQTHQLCWFLLTYLYTLPNQVAGAQGRRAGQ